MSGRAADGGKSGGQAQRRGVSGRPADGGKSGGQAQRRRVEEGRPGPVRRAVEGERDRGRGGDQRGGSGRGRSAGRSKARPRNVASPTRRRRRARIERDRALEPDGPHVTLGILWAAATIGATMEGTVWSAMLLAPVAGLAAASAFRSWNGHPDRDPPTDAAAPPPPLALMAGSASVAVVLASIAGLWATLAVGVLVVIGVIATEVKGSTGRPGLVRRVLLILLPAAAGSGVVLARAQGGAEGVALVAMISVYDLAAYLIGTGARFALEGPIAGWASIGAMTLFIAALPPFAGDTPWILGGVVAVLAPFGPIVARRLAASPRARVPALRRLDSLILAGPAWAAATALLLHT